ncbi:MAG: MerR family transcriptional regulator [Candidatus Aminicenantes bacterium]|jgi:DNA-binding transcriptional MerR regulator
MKKIVFEKESLIKQLGISEATLDEWEQIKLLKPDGVTDHEQAFYSRHTLETGLYIKNLLDLGYGMTDVRRIIKKIGLPNRETALDKKAHVREFLTVGDLADRVGVSPRAIKHWEDMGIIEPDMRSGGGFRLYSENYVYICQLIRDLQLFGYSLKEIKEISVHFRDFLSIKGRLQTYSVEETEKKLDEMLRKIQIFFDKMELYKEGLERWEELLRKKKREIVGLKAQNTKRSHPKEKGR